MKGPWSTRQKTVNSAGLLESLALVYTRNLRLGRVSATLTIRVVHCNHTVGAQCGLFQTLACPWEKACTRQMMPMCE